MSPKFDYPATRTTDPESSHIAEERVTLTGIRGRQAVRVFLCLRRHDGSTAGELGQYLDNNSYRGRQIAGRRLNDLKIAGWVSSGKMRHCNVCNQKCQTWYIVKKL